MVKVTFDAPPDDRALMQQHPEVNWSEIFRQAIHRQVRMAEVAQRLVEEDADPRVQAIAQGLKQGTSKRFIDATCRS